MNITFDPAKDEANRAKHGVSLALAQSFEWDDAVDWVDARHEYGEVHHTAIGYIGKRLYVVIYTDRFDSRRIISLRKANNREESKYARA